MQELRLVAVSEDGSYAILAVPGRGGRFSLPIDDRLRTVARGQFSRLAQYEIEVENPLRPKEIQDRIRAGETADEIADLAGIPIDRVRRFEGPVLAEREYRAQDAQRATVRSPGDSGPGPRLGEIVAERLAQAGASAEDARWDSRKRSDGHWQGQLMFTAGDREAGEIVCYKDISHEEFWIRGHIPGRPLMPGVIMIEAAAQMCSLYFSLVSAMDKFIGFGGVDEVKFRGQVVPGDKLQFACRTPD